MINIVINGLMRKLHEKYKCRADCTGGKILITSLHVSISRQELTKIIDSVIKKLCSEEEKLQNEINVKDYFDIIVDVNN